jgi:hypothetical protein
LIIFIIFNNLYRSNGIFSNIPNFYWKNIQFFLTMDSKSHNPLIIRLKNEMRRRKVKPPEFEAITGIPKDRVYKWFKNQATKTNSEDAEVIQKWINGNLDNVPHGILSATAQGSSQVSTKISGINTEVLEKNQSIERSIEILTEDRTRVLSVIERLTALLEKKYEDEVKASVEKQWLELAPPGSPNTVTQIPEKFKNKKERQ